LGCALLLDGIELNHEGIENMAIELKTHTALTTHSPAFTLTGATSYSVDLVGTIAAGSDAVELQIQLPSGAFMQLATPIRFGPADVGGTKLTGPIPANAVLRWFVPGVSNNVSTKITSTHG
jgi:hypothetical protein